MTLPHQLFASTGYGTLQELPLGSVTTVSEASTGGARPDSHIQVAQSVATLSETSTGTGRACAVCGRSLAARRSQARFCSPACRHRAFMLHRGCPRCRGKLVVDPGANGTT
jgi:hypothetical protein